MPGPLPATLEVQPDLDLSAFTDAFQIYFPSSLNEFQAAFDIYNNSNNKTEQQLRIILYPLHTLYLQKGAF